MTERQSMDWQKEFRAQFPAASQCVYLDNAYDCGGTLWGAAAAKRYFQDWTEAAARNERGGPGRETLFRTLDETRGLLLRLIGGAGGERIAFTRNTNEGINAILQGFDFQQGDNIVTDGQEHASVLMPCLNVGRTRGIEVRVVPARGDGRVEIRELLAAADAHTRILLVSHVQSATGFRLDLETLGNCCKERGIFLVVDAIQSLGLAPFFAKKWQLSAVSASSYKGLCGVNSTAFTYYTPELLEHIWPVYTAAGPCMTTEVSEGTYTLRCKDCRSARKMENSSLDNLGIYVLHDSLERILGIGTEAIAEHIGRLYDRMYAGLAALGYTLVTPSAKEEHGAILSLRTADPQGMFAFFRSQGIVLSISADTYIRFSLGAYNDAEDIGRLLEAAKRCPLR